MVEPELSDIAYMPELESEELAAQRKDQQG